MKKKKPKTLTQLSVLRLANNINYPQLQDDVFSQLNDPKKRTCRQTGMHTCYFLSEKTSVRSSACKSRAECRYCHRKNMNDIITLTHTLAVLVWITSSLLWSHSTKMSHFTPKLLIHWDEWERLWFSTQNLELVLQKLLKV